MDQLNHGLLTQANIQKASQCITDSDTNVDETIDAPTGVLRNRAGSILKLVTDARKKSTDRNKNFTIRIKNMTGKDVIPVLIVALICAVQEQWSPMRFSPLVFSVDFQSCQALQFLFRIISGQSEIMTFAGLRSFLRLLLAQTTNPETAILPDEWE